MSGAPDVGPQPVRRSLDLAGRVALRPREAAEALGLSERTLDDLIRRRAIPSVAVGRSRLIPVRRLIRWLEEQADAQERPVEEAVRDALRKVAANPSEDAR